MPSPGDAIGFKTGGLFAFWIRQGQRIIALGVRGFVRVAFTVLVLRRPWPADLDWCRVTHCAIYVGGGNVVGSGKLVDESALANSGWPWVLMPFPRGNADRPDVCDFANSCLGRKYGVLSVVSRALNCLTPKFLQIGTERAGDMDCSTLVVRAWEHGGVILPWSDVYQVTPGQIFLAYGGAS